MNVNFNGERYPVQKQKKKKNKKKNGPIPCVYRQVTLSTRTMH